MKYLCVQLVLYIKALTMASASSQVNRAAQRRQQNRQRKKEKLNFKWLLLLLYGRVFVSAWKKSGFFSISTFIRLLCWCVFGDQRRRRRKKSILLFVSFEIWIWLVQMNLITVWRCLNVSLVLLEILVLILYLGDTYFA